MKNLFYVLLIFFSVACSTQKQNLTIDEEILGTTLKYEMLIKNGSQFQVDSLITADTLPKLDMWYSTVFIDYETNNGIKKQVYIKKNNQLEITYIIIGNKEPFYIEKRIRK